MGESGSSSSAPSLGSDKVSSINLYNKTAIEDKGFAPIDIEIQIQNERIIAIFDEAIIRTEYAVFLSISTLKEINFAIRKVISYDDFQFIRKIFREGKLNPTMGTDDVAGNIYNPITDEKVQEIIAKPDPKILPELSQIIKILLGYPELRPIIQREIQWEKTPLANAVLFLDSLIRFRNRMEEKITMSALEKLKREIVQRNLNRTNNVLKAKIAEVSKKVKEENSTYNHIYKQKRAIINNHQEELEHLKNDCVTVIKKKILESEKIMIRETGVHKLNYEDLVEKEKATLETYETLLKDNLQSEKNLRAKRFKTETQLLNWLRKYDQEIGDKQSELDELTTNYENEKEQLADLQKRFDEQEIIYKPLMAEKEAEYQADLAIRIQNFAMGYAATKIQRYWRKILAAEKARKKKRKRGKK